MVFAKRDIPVDMKFGPFVGEPKTLNKHEIKKYRETCANYPLLFLNQNSILDVSNESTYFKIHLEFSTIETKFISFHL